ncbi:hypothetical protein CIPAW_02G002200 [Carya illinoinensis]|uniref:Uncharacterized protein n=1 Tax=Carya illinoinensis TaxID=32201 RepID=A0A8T1R8X8_CARIL|nr:hypothetical protein CIPAW_02G002200 [Carya illinoinensis]
MGPVLFESCIIEPPKSWRQNRSASETIPRITITRSTVTQPRQERLSVVLGSREADFHACQRGQPIISLNETWPSRRTTRVHETSKCIMSSNVSELKKLQREKETRDTRESDTERKMGCDEI